MAVAAVTGLIAKENVVGTFGILFGFAEVAEDGVLPTTEGTAQNQEKLRRYSAVIESGGMKMSKKTGKKETCKYVSGSYRRTQLQKELILQKLREKDFRITRQPDRMKELGHRPFIEQLICGKKSVKLAEKIGIKLHVT